MIRVEHIYKSFGNVHAVKDVSLSVAKGEVVGLLGPNGAGKTTTMRMITGFLMPDSGDVFIKDIPVSFDSVDTRALIGYLPENAPLYLDMEVSEFLRYIAEIRNISSANIKKRIDEMVSVCGLSAVVGRVIGQLSRGFRQRVGLAQALIHHPPILILDEPTSGLDPNQIIEIRDLIKEIGVERTVILSTHIMQEVEATCSRAFIVNQGEVVGQGTLKELMSARKGATRYHLTVNALRPEIEERVEKLGGIHFVDYEGISDEKWQKIILHTDSKDDRGEDIFKWVVGNSWALRELHEEKVSLEDVFRNLTIGE